MDETPPPPISPSRSLADGRLLAALTTLIVNDHFLKAHYGSWWTGKLSDVAGLVVLPVLIVVVSTSLAGVQAGTHRQRRHLTISLGLIALWFTAMKTFSPAAAATERLMETMTGFEATILVDPTDLIGLTGLVVARWVVLRPRPIVSAKSIKIGVLVVGGVACVASGPDYELNTDLVVTEEGHVISPVNDSGEVSDEGEDPATLNEVGLSRSACSPIEPGLCFRLSGYRIEQKREDGIWQTVWAYDKSTALSSEFSFYSPRPLSDILITPDGTVHAKFPPMRGSVVRSADGRWNPSSPALRSGEIGAWSVAMLIGASLYMLTLVKPGGRWRWFCLSASTLASGLHFCSLTRDAGDGYAHELVVVWLLLATMCGFVALMFAINQFMTNRDAVRRGVAVALVGGLISAAPLIWWDRTLTVDFWVALALSIGLSCMSAVVTWLLTHSSPETPERWAPTVVPIDQRRPPLR